MYRNTDFIYEAITQIEYLTDLNINFESNRNNHMPIIIMEGVQFNVEVRSAVRTSNLGLVLSQLQEKMNESNRPLILIAEYISKNATQKLKELGINYIDIAGNAFIKDKGLTIFIEGQKKIRRENTNQSRAFQEAGVKIIFALLYSSWGMERSYREIAHIADVSIGSVSNVMNELEDLNYILKTDNGRVLKNQNDLLERWMIAYNDVLRPRILRKRMRFIYPEDNRKWNHEYSFRVNERVLWGGEPAAAIKGTNLRPEKFTIYTNAELSEIAKTMKLVPDPEGEIEILQKFWNDSLGLDNINDHNEFYFKMIVPSLLIYTDLINSGNGRNIETAKIIKQNELQYI
jgi:hypothetical protein